MHNSVLLFLNRKPSPELTRQALETNFSKIVTYLEPNDHVSLKLCCRFLYYNFITQEIWTGLKWGIAEEKMEYYDDYDFVEQEPKPISKKDKNIRIHSLKKSNKQTKKRQASNIKEKGKTIETINEINFRTTEIGFKRLLKTNKKIISDEPSFNEAQGMLQLPKNKNINDFIINSKDPWSLNMKKAQELINLVKKWNQFHHKFATSIKKTQKSWKDFLQKLRQKDQDVKIYKDKFSTETYKAIVQYLEGSRQNLLIDEQLNKVGKLFYSYHLSMREIFSLEQFIQNLQAQVNKISTKLEDRVESTVFLQFVGKVDESVQNFINLGQKHEEIVKLTCSTVIQLYYSSLQSFEGILINIEDNEPTTMRSIHWRHICLKPQFYEFLFQMLMSTCGKLLKLINTFCRGQITINMIYNKLENMKKTCQNVWNISKYFSKLKKQIQSKQRKGKDQKLTIILEFVSQYEQKPKEELLYQPKNPTKIDKLMAEFKQHICLLKSSIQSN